ncbi:MAG: amidophosphoribosyltransferase [bacterium]|nr:amidophosphoribosyltransferase [bacterium]
MRDDKPREACGVFGIFGHPDAALLTHLGLYALQHRGQESAGIVSGDNGHFYVHKNMGLVSEVFNEKNLKALKGNRAIGHVRYSTTGSSLLTNAQPIVIDYYHGTIAIGHNGNLTNADELRNRLESMGSIFQTTTDSEVILHLLAKPSFTDGLERLHYVLSQIQGAYSLVLMTETDVIGIRDPHGLRPLCLGKLDDAYILSSESCALDLIGAKLIRDVEPGEIVILNQNGITSHKPLPKERSRFCIFEYVYFARPDSIINGQTVHTVREKMGKNLAVEHPIDADLVISVPDSGNAAAMGFAEQSGIKYEMGFIRNHYVGRTFLKPSQVIRNFSTKIKLNPLHEVIRNKRVVVVDDSIVRGTTSRSRITSLRDAGAKEIHMRISCPPHKYPCYYGIDFPTTTELIASKKTVEEIAKYIGADSLGYLSEQGLLNSVGGKDEYCMACYTGDYSISPPENARKEILEKNHTIIL